MPEISQEHAKLVRGESISQKQRDLSFPTPSTLNIPEDVLEQAAKIVSSTKSESRHLTTPTSGRNMFTVLKEQIIFDQDSFTWINTKGGGSNASIDEDSTPYRTDERFENGGEVTGHLSVEEARKDAVETNIAMNLGVRTRVPIAGFFLNRITVNSVDYTAQEFIEKFRAHKKNSSQDSIHSEHPYIAEYLTRNPFKMLDIEAILEKSVEEKVIQPDLVLAFLSGIVAWRNDKEEVYQNLWEKWRQVLETKTVSAEQVLMMSLDAINSQQVIMARNLAKLHNKKLTHGNIHGQNIGFFTGELGDFVTQKADSSADMFDDDTISYVEELKYMKKRLIKFATTFQLNSNAVNQVLGEQFIFSSNYLSEKGE